MSELSFNFTELNALGFAANTTGARRQIDDDAQSTTTRLLSENDPVFKPTTTQPKVHHASTSSRGAHADPAARNILPTPDVSNSSLASRSMDESSSVWSHSAVNLSANSTNDPWSTTTTPAAATQFTAGAHPRQFTPLNNKTASTRPTHTAYPFPAQQNTTANNHGPSAMATLSDLLSTADTTSYLVLVLSLDSRTTTRSLYDMFFPMGGSKAQILHHERDLVELYNITSTILEQRNQEGVEGPEIAAMLPELSVRIQQQQIAALLSSSRGRRAAGVVFFSSAEAARMASAKFNDFVPHGQTHPLVVVYAATSHVKNLHEGSATEVHYGAAAHNVRSNPIQNRIEPLPVLFNQCFGELRRKPLHAISPKPGQRFAALLVEVQRRESSERSTTDVAAAALYCSDNILRYSDDDALDMILLLAEVISTKRPRIVLVACEVVRLVQLAIHTANSTTERQLRSRFQVPFSRAILKSIMTASEDRNCRMGSGVVAASLFHAGLIAGNAFGLAAKLMRTHVLSRCASPDRNEDASIAAACMEAVDHNLVDALQVMCVAAKEKLPKGASAVDEELNEFERLVSEFRSKCVASKVVDDVSSIDSNSDDDEHRDDEHRPAIAETFCVTAGPPTPPSSQTVSRFNSSTNPLLMATVPHNPPSPSAVVTSHNKSATSQHSSNGTAPRASQRPLPRTPPPGANDSVQSIVSTTSHSSGDQHHSEQHNQQNQHQSGGSSNNSSSSVAKQQQRLAVASSKTPPSTASPMQHQLDVLAATVYITKIPRTMSEARLRVLFEQFGELNKVRIYDPKSLHHRPAPTTPSTNANDDSAFGFVEFATAANARAMINGLDRSTIQLLADKVTQPEWTVMTPMAGGQLKAPPSGVSILQTAVLRCSPARSAIHDHDQTDAVIDPATASRLKPCTFGAPSHNNNSLAMSTTKLSATAASWTPSTSSGPNTSPSLSTSAQPFFPQEPQ